jgi:hypothetical protein
MNGCENVGVRPAFAGWNTMVQNHGIVTYGGRVAGKLQNSPLVLILRIIIQAWSEDQRLPYLYLNIVQM